MNQSKAMKTLVAKLNAAKSEAQALNADDKATLEQINAKTAEIDVLNAKIKQQESLDKGKEYDDKGEEVKDVTPVNTPIFAEPASHKGPFNSFGEQLMAIVKSSKRGNPVDERLMKVQNASGANETNPSEGGFLVQTDFSTEILKTVYDVGVLPSLCREVPITTNANGIKINGIDETSRVDGSRWGGVQAYWVDEAGTVTASKPKFRKIELELKKVMAIYYSTEELLADASAAEGIMKQAFGEEIAFKLDDAIFNGDGSGKPLGIINSPCLVTQAKASGQANDTVIHENIENMWNRMYARWRNNAVWLINQEVEPQLSSMAFPLGTGGVISPYAQEYMLKGTIKGRPVKPIEHAAKLGDAGDIVLADMSQYLLATKGGVKTASSMHILFLYDEMAFRVTYRVDGEPVLASAITPYKATSGRTVSPFVALQAR